MMASETKYEELYETLEKEIRTKLRPGDSLDAERTLVERFGVSRMTVRNALSQLEEKGLVVRVHGSGTYVNDSVLIGKTLRLTSFTEDMRERGLTASAIVLKSVTKAAGPEVAASLKIEPDDEVLLLRRLRLANEVPMALEEAHVPLGVFPGLHEKDLRKSLYEAFQKYGYKVERARQQMTAVTLTREESDLLQTPPQSPALRVQRVSTDRLGLSLEVVSTIYRADRYEFDVTVRAEL